MVKVILNMILSCYLTIILFEFSYKIKIISMSNNFDAYIEIALDTEIQLIELPYPLAVVSRTSNFDDLLETAFRSMPNMTLTDCNF